MLNTVSPGCSPAKGTSSFELKASLISRSFMPQRAPSHPTTSLSTACHATGDEGKREQSEPVKSHVEQLGKNHGAVICQVPMRNSL
jgi:hypothetical protein